MRKIDVNKIVKKINKIVAQKIDIGIVVGSGVELSFLTNIKEISYSFLGMPKNKVSGHTGKFVFGSYKGKNIIVFSRYHFYEYNDISIVRLPYEILNALGVKTILMQSSCGAVNKKLNVGDILVVKDHINFTGINPLIDIKPLKFINMSNSYEKSYIDKIVDIAKENSIEVQKGIHMQFSGPSYETVAELQMAQGFNADSVSMSIAYDCLICRYFDIKVLALVFITNKFCETGDCLLDHKEVLKQAKIGSDKINILLKQFIIDYKN